MRSTRFPPLYRVTPASGLFHPDDGPVSPFPSQEKLDSTAPSVQKQTFMRSVYTFTEPNILLPSFITFPLPTMNLISFLLFLHFVNNEKDDLFTEEELEVMDAEGRVVVTDHGPFVLINVYAPTTSTPKRLEFKLRFCLALQRRIEAIISVG